MAQYAVEGKFVDREVYIKSKEKAIADVQPEAEKAAKPTAKETK